MCVAFASMLVCCSGGVVGVDVDVCCDVDCGGCGDG